MKTYECTNTACPLGMLGQPGYFTGGITHAYLTQLTGNPAPTGVADQSASIEGQCPNCGKKGKAI